MILKCLAAVTAAAAAAAPAEVAGRMPPAANAAYVMLYGQVDNTKQGHWQLFKASTTAGYADTTVGTRGQETCSLLDAAAACLSVEGAARDVVADADENAAAAVSALAWSLEASACCLSCSPGCLSSYCWSCGTLTVNDGGNPAGLLLLLLLP